jgi:thioredoxin 1
MSELIIDIDDSSFEDNIIKSSENQPVLVDFWAPWCGPCQSLSPILNEVASELPSVKFCKVNIDKSTAYASKFGVRSIPLILIFKNGEIVGRQLGVLPKEQLKEFIEKSIND